MSVFLSFLFFTVLIGISFKIGSELYSSFQLLSPVIIQETDLWGGKVRLRGRFLKSYDYFLVC